VLLSPLGTIVVMALAAGQYALRRKKAPRARPKNKSPESGSGGLLVRNWGSKFLLRFVHRIFVNTRGGLPVPFAVCRSASFFEKRRNNFMASARWRLRC
jgi:hypothetical protein